MSSPEHRGVRADNRLAGEDVPTWVTVGFAAVGTFVAGAAAWLALNGQFTAPSLAESDVAREQAARPASMATTEDAATRAPEREPGPAPVSPRTGDEPAAAAARSAAPISGTTTAASTDVGGQPQPPSESRLGSAEDCPPAVDIPFNLESARPITKDVRMALTQLQAFMEKHADARLSVEGHADSSGAEEYNLLLSHRRAKAVVSLLANAGLSEKRMAIRAAGDSTPIEGVPPVSGKNRRVVLRVVGVESCQGAAGARLR